MPEPALKPWRGRLSDDEPSQGCRRRRRCHRSVLRDDARESRSRREFCRPGRHLGGHPTRRAAHHGQAYENDPPSGHRRSSPDRRGRRSAGVHQDISGRTGPGGLLVIPHRPGHRGRDHSERGGNSSGGGRHRGTTTHLSRCVPGVGEDRRTGSRGRHGRPGQHPHRHAG